MSEENEKKFFKEGDEVAHKENPNLKMEVRRIIKIKRSVPGSDPKEFHSFTVGIECGWWKASNNGEQEKDNFLKDDYRKEVFHSKSLVPWDVAQLGFVAMLEWLKTAKKK